MLSNIWGGFAENEARTRALVGELRATLDSGNQAAASVRAAADSLGALVTRVKPPGEPTGKPFDIAEYRAAATEIGRSAAQFDMLLSRLNEEAPALQGLLKNTSDEADRLMNDLFWRLAAVVLLLPIAWLAAALAYVALAPHVRRVNRR